MRRILAPLSLLATVSATSLSAAQPRTTDPAAAQALFYEARRLMNENKFAPACTKLEESLRLDYGMGTEFNLADCNEKLGRTASAWSGFVNVAAAAKAQNQPQREKVARERARALDARLPKLQIEVGSAVPPGVEVRRDNVLVGPAAWGTASPVDPGVHRVVASAPGRQDWVVTATAVEGKTARVLVPVLKPVPPAEPVALAPSAGGSVDPAPMTSYPETVVARSGGTQRAVGFIVGGLGIGALGVAAGFGLDSLNKRDRAKDHCSGDACDETGIALRDRALSSGDVATVTTIAGGAALLGGLVLVLTAPKGGARHAREAKGLRFSPRIARNGGGLSLDGVLP